jgi:hypothetical protein
MTVRLHPAKVALKLPKKVPEVIVFAIAVVEAMTGNSWFPAPVPSLAVVQAAIDKLREAEAAGLSLMAGLKAARNVELGALTSLLRGLKAYVEGVADDNPESAATIIESAGMSVAARATLVKAVLAVLRGRVSGSVRLVVRAVAKVARYEWQLSENGGKTWVNLPTTMKASTTVTGLVPGRTYWFRFRAVTRRAAGDWCDPVPYIVQ